MKLFDKKQNVILLKINTFGSNPTIEMYDATIVKSNGIRNGTYTLTYSDKNGTVLINEENCRFIFANKKEANVFIKSELEAGLKNAESSVNRYKGELEMAINRCNTLTEILKQY